jgi:hypothetical protein
MPITIVASTAVNKSAARLSHRAGAGSDNILCNRTASGRKPFDLRAMCAIRSLVYLKLMMPGVPPLRKRSCPPLADLMGAVSGPLAVLSSKKRGELAIPLQQHKRAPDEGSHHPEPG